MNQFFIIFKFTIKIFVNLNILKQYIMSSPTSLQAYTCPDAPSVGTSIIMATPYYYVFINGNPVTVADGNVTTIVNADTLTCKWENQSTNTTNGSLGGTINVVVAQGMEYDIAFSNFTVSEASTVVDFQIGYAGMSYPATGTCTFENNTWTLSGITTDFKGPQLADGDYLQYVPGLPSTLTGPSPNVCSGVTVDNAAQWYFGTSSDTTLYPELSLYAGIIWFDAIYGSGLADDSISLSLQLGAGFLSQAFAYLYNVGG